MTHPSSFSGVDPGDDAYGLCSICGDYIFGSDVDSGRAFWECGNPLPPHHNDCLRTFVETGALQSDAVEYYEHRESYWRRHMDVPAGTALELPSSPGHPTLAQAKKFLYDRAAVLAPLEKPSIRLAAILAGAESLPVFPCRYPFRRDLLFPKTVLNGAITAPSEKRLLGEARSDDGHLLFVVLLPSRKPEAGELAREDLLDVGVLASLKLANLRESADCMADIVCLERVRVSWDGPDPSALKAAVTTLPAVADLDLDAGDTKDRIERLRMIVRDVGQQIFPPSALHLWLDASHGLEPRGLGELLDVFAFYAGKDSLWENDLFPYRYAVLEAASLGERLRATTTLGEIFYDRVLKTRNFAQEEAAKAAEHDRRNTLRAQLELIRKELGETEGADVESYRAQLASLPLPENVRKQVETKLRRLEHSAPSSQESAVLAAYLDLILELPWVDDLPEAAYDTARAREILDRDHYGLGEVKTRILEILAVRELRRRRNVSHSSHMASVLGFVGPPGVGKTSLGERIAETLGRPFVRLSLGGVSDEATIRGHRFTYVGAEPGCLLDAVRKVKTRQPVVMLDEIDKLGMQPGTIYSSVASALLELLDPHQNSGFRDHYLGTSYDLSAAFFIVTANSLEPIPPALRDRIEFLEFPGYSEEEKLEIARRHLIPSMLGEHGLGSGDCVFTEDAITALIRSHPKDPGVRYLERAIANICRKVASSVVEGVDGQHLVSSATLGEYLPEPRKMPVRPVGFRL